MSSPSSQTPTDSQTQWQDLSQLASQQPFHFYLKNPKIRFCPECNNMLYPRENKENKKLVFFCRACLYQKEARSDQMCTYVNKITHEINELAHINPEVTDDPTLARTKGHPCPQCGHIEAVFMQGSLRDSDDCMKLYYVCTNRNCRFKWTE